MSRVRELTEAAERCHREVALEFYNTLSGRQDKLDIVSILKRYPQLYSRESYDYIMGLGERECPDERERRFLRLLFTRNYFTDRLKEQSERLANAEGDATVECDGQSYPYRALPVVLANEEDYARRGRLDGAYIARLEQLNPQREEIDAVSRELTGELGYRNLIELVEKLARMRIYPLREICGRFLDETEELYAERLEQHASKTAALSRAQLRHADIGFLMRARQFDHQFPADGMAPALAKTLSGLGIDLEKQKNVTLDLDVRPKKSPRAFCISIDAPHDVRLVLLPRGGQDDYSTLLHEAGHLEFSANMAPGLSFLYRQHGDTSVHESYAFLLQHLTSDPVWWHEIMHADPGEYLHFSRFERLYFIRRYSAKLHYEVEYHEAGGGPAPAGQGAFREVYAKWLERGCAIPYPPQRYLADFDAGFYVAQYLQAWIWEVQLREHLRREFGEAWFTRRSAGDFLRDLWREGMKYDVWEIAGKLGYKGLDIAPLTAEVTG